MVSGFYWHPLLMEMEVSLHFLYLFEVVLSQVMIVAGCTLFQKKAIVTFAITLAKMDQFL